MARPAVRRGGRCRHRRHPVVDDPSSEVAFVDPRDDRFVVPVGNQQREGKAVQHPLGGALPFGGFRPDLDQLAREGELVGIDVEVGAQPARSSRLLLGRFVGRDD